MRKKAWRRYFRGSIGAVCIMVLFAGCGKAEKAAQQETMTALENEEQAEEQIEEKAEEQAENQEDYYDENASLEEILSLDTSKYTPLDYKVNHYAMPSAYKEIFPENQIQFYYKVVDAFLNYETSVSFEKEEDINNLWGLLRANFPLFDGDLENRSVNYDYNKKELSWTYKSTSKEEHDQLIAEFEKKIAGYMKNISQEDTDTEKAFLIFENFTAEIKYNYEISDKMENFLVDDIDISSYYALMKGDGVCVNYASAFCYLLNQVSIDAVEVGGCPAPETGEMGHAWSMMKLNDKWYYSDPTWSEDNEGYLEYFAFTQKAREEDGYVSDSFSFCGSGDLNLEDYFEVTDTRFDTLRESVRIRGFDREKDELICDTIEGEILRFDMR